MLAERETPAFDDPRFLKHFPIWVSGKLDGIRLLSEGAIAVSRKRIPFPSAYVQRAYGRLALHGIDGELGVGPPTSSTFYRDTFSGVMTHGCEDPVCLFAFDLWNRPEDYLQRWDALVMLVRDYCKDLPVYLWPSQIVHTIDELVALEETALAEGYEGLIARNPRTPYKFGRSTLNQGMLIKIVRTVDVEAEIIGFEELMHNANEATVDNLGYTKRSSHLAGMVGMSTLGALIVRQEDGLEYKVGVFKGYSKADLQEMWNVRETLLGQLAKIRYKPYGVKDRPRHPRFIGIRARMDT